MRYDYGTQSFATSGPSYPKTCVVHLSLDTRGEGGPGSKFGRQSGPTQIEVDLYIEVLFPLDFQRKE